MALLELQQEVPDLFERVERLMNEGIVYAEFKPPRKTFHKGLFLDGNSIYGVLGYDSALRLMLNYVPSPEISDFNTPENVRILPADGVQIINCNYEFSPDKGGLTGKVKFTKKEPLILEVIITSNGLDAPPFKQGEEDKVPHLDVPQELVDVVKNMGLKDNRAFTNRERTNFKFEDVIPLLEWIKINMSYGKSRPVFLTYDEMLKDKCGICMDISSLFEAMVYIAGGLTRNMSSTFTLNLPLSGWDYFSKSATTLHNLTQIYSGGRWQVVDSTIYNTTYHNPKIPNGVEKRAYSPAVRNYHIIRIPNPIMQFPDRKLQLDLLGSIKRKLSGLGMYATLYPSVIKESIQVLK